MFGLRVASLTDVPQIESLIQRSVRGLSTGFYSPEQVEAALVHVFGVDSQLIRDGSYFVIDDANGIAAAGGWSHRRTLFGGDQMKGEEDPRLDPAREPARIRAFFVRPDCARRGLATTLYEACNAAARAMGFARFELMATLPGEPLYAALGFSPIERIAIAVEDDIVLPLVRMTRDIHRDDEG